MRNSTGCDRYGLTLSLYKCKECGFIFAEDKEITELTSLYERLSDPEYEKTQKMRALQMRLLLDLAKTVHPGAVSLLDIGAGSGLLVAEAKRLGFDAVGVEPSRRLVEMAQKVNEVKIFPGAFPHPLLTGQLFDLIFVVDVIEHVSNPVELLRYCAGALRPGGVIVVVTPDVGSLSARIFGQRWWHFRLAHVGYFSRSTLNKAIEAAGLSAICQRSRRWVFSVRYLAERLVEYVPVGWVNRLAIRVQPLRWLYGQVIQLNLHDSLVLFAQCTSKVRPR